MKDKSTPIETNWIKTPAFKDLVLIGLIAILSLILVEALELAETLDKVARGYEWPIYKFITVPVTMSFAFGLYSLQRWKELRHEITERKETERKLRLAKEMYRTIFENSAVAITMADEQERLIAWNKFAENLLGMDGEDLYLRPISSLYPAREWERIRNHHLRQKGMQHHMETKMIKKDGAVIDIDISLSVLKKSEGETIGSLGVFRDITDRRRMEEDLRKYREHLEDLVEQRTEELTLANRELRRFAHIAAHDLKAPLRAIGTLADWISTDYADKFDKQGKREVELLVGRVARMSDMIDSILRYSEAGRVVKEKEKVNLNALIEEVMAGIAPPENISITVENELPVVEGEKKHFMQVFQDLLSNAVKYMDKPKGQIKVGCIKENGFWKFSVADNGPGIEKEYSEKIFELFQTLLPRDEFEATGVGLSVVKKIVELYGGSVWVESEFGKGSVFFFTLPNQEMKVADDAKLQANIVS